MMLNIFSCAYCHLYILFGSSLFHWSLFPIFKLDFVFLLLSHLSDVWFAYMFPQSIGCLFYSLNSIFHRAKFEIFLRSNLLLFSFMVMQLELCVRQNSLPNPSLWSFSPVFSYKSFMIKKKTKHFFGFTSS